MLRAAAKIFIQDRWPQIRRSAQSQRQEDTSAGAIEALLVPWLAFQNQSELAAEALVEAGVALFQSGWTVERVQLEMAFLTLKSKTEEIKQVQELDSEMLLSFVCLIMITCKVNNHILLEILFAHNHCLVLVW